MSRYHLECGGRGVGGRLMIVNEKLAKSACIGLRTFFGREAVRLFDTLSGEELLPVEAPVHTAMVYTFPHRNPPSDPDHMITL